MIAIILSNLT